MCDHTIYLWSYLAFKYLRQYQFNARRELPYNGGRGEADNSASFFFALHKNAVLLVEKKKVLHKFTATSNFAQ